MLQVKNLTAGYGSIKVLQGLSFGVNSGEAVTMIGGNGAGKTTTLKAITGMIRATGGEIEFLGQRIEHLPPHKICKLGISMVPEGRQIFPLLTIEKNLRLGAYIHDYTEKEMLNKMDEV
ncbi:MAG: ATP-binding cassette domain-containing protein, partial [Deltaproteobacteria bacterium]|nr:ATP-binding cassette domain-containing protein [Deltaproteobacteria bacterium]